MNKYSYCTEYIKSRVTMLDVINLYTPNVTPRNNRIPCPIHHGDGYNFLFSDNGYKCFVCGSGGDVISYVINVFNLSFLQAIIKLNTDFNLCLPIDRRMTLREQSEARKQAIIVTAERLQKEAQRKAKENRYNELCDEYARLDKNRIIYAPKSPDEEPHPLYIEAIQNIDRQQYLIDCALEQDSEVI